ncbi:sialin [Toxorhynchites rutilus septentrionalis]|uniref:sialin n=1 Tax=Toxorhynchites rutilus septentrionalis TaxID=329112 RepID=UPI0024793962|nr:sialin [Toxorhynchites rutilus septentrionalis]
MMEKFSSLAKMAREPRMNARTVLWYLVFVGFAVNYMIRINMNITIVTMVKQTGGRRESQHVASDMSVSGLNFTTVLPTQQQQPKMYACYVERNESWTPSNLDDGSSLVTSQQMQPKLLSPEIVLLKALKFDISEKGFEWDEYQQGLILGAFFWIHWITQVPGGVLARKYGTKMVFGVANAIGCWLCFLMPLASYVDYRVLIFLRVIQGLICGVAWPAMHHMAGQWIPPNERSKFVTAYLGSSVGVALNFPLFGYIISWTSWEYVFHFCGIIGTIWYIAWIYMVYDSPAEHPRIHPKERDYIESSLGITDKSKIQERQQRTPWMKMTFSKAMWMNVIAQWSGIWGLFTLMTQAPSYFNYIHGWDIKMTGILSGIPHLGRMLFAYFFSIVGDYLLQRNLMSRTNVRKIGGVFCCLINGIFVLALAYSGCNATLAIVFLTLATMVHGAVSTGPLANIIDMSPKYAGILLGISGMITVVPGFVSPIIVGLLTLGNQTVKQWEYVFLIAASMLIVSGILYTLFADSTLQAWNSMEDTDALDGKELVNLKVDVEDTVQNTEKKVSQEIER